MDLPDILPWATLQVRLTWVLEQSPRPEYLKNPDPCIQRVIRLRDIADYCRLQRQEIYRVRRGDRRLKPEVQQVLSWFFFNFDRGRIAKEKCLDGKWRIVPTKPQVPADAADARPKAIEATVDFLNGRLTLGSKMS